MNIVNVYIPEKMFAYQPWGFHDGKAMESQCLLLQHTAQSSEFIRSHLVTGPVVFNRPP